MTVPDTSAVHPSSLSLRWQRAAMLGSLWAANEIVLGSFLHNLSIPFAGTVLAAIGVTLLVAGHRLWNDPGVLWRAGVICSLMKSISPSAVILGPMVGILAEAGLVYVSVVVFRGLLIGSLIGGALATVTPILQKIISILVTYGMDAARMYTTLFTVFSDRLRFQAVDAEGALFILVAAQAIPGALAAMLGIAIARGVNRAAPPRLEAASASGNGEQIFPAGSQQYSLTALCAHGFLIPTGLAFLPLLPPLLTLIPVALYLLLVLYWYPGLRRKFARSRLWLEFGAVAILAGILLGILAPGGKGTWWTGLQSGIVMTARATLVVTAFSALSIELRSPAVINWFLRRGLGSVSAALSAAFRALPVMIDSLNQQRHNMRHPLRAFSEMLATMLAQLQEDSRNHGQPAVYLLTGSQGEGKTTVLEQAITRIRNEGVAVAGILSRVRYADGERIGYDVEDVSTGERAVLCRRDHDAEARRNHDAVARRNHDAGARRDHAAGVPSVGPFVFHREGLSLGAKALAALSEHPVSVIVVDEVGPLELRGEGWAAPVRSLLNSAPRTILLVVRPALVEQIQQEWRFVAQSVWDVSQTSDTEIARVLTGAAHSPEGPLS